MRQSMPAFNAIAETDAPGCDLRLDELAHEMHVVVTTDWSA